MSQIVSPFKKAQRKQVRLKIAFAGPSGSGKTYSALRLAKGLGGRVALIDTENGSASLYSEHFDFDSLDLNPPFSVDSYIRAIDIAVELQYDVLIIDSISHQWKELLAKKEKLDTAGRGNSFVNWAKVTPEYDKFVSAITHSDIHLIATMRSKHKYEINEGEGKGGKATVQKVGMEPVQRDGLEYEFTTMFDITMSNLAMVSKDRTGLFTGQIFQVTEGTGEKMMQWLLKGAEVPVGASKAKQFEEVINRNRWTVAEATDYVRETYGKERVLLCTSREYQLLVAHVEANPKPLTDDELAALKADADKASQPSSVH